MSKEPRNIDTSAPVLRGETEEENRLHIEIEDQMIRRAAEKERKRRIQELKAHLEPELKQLVEEMQDTLRFNYLQREGRAHFGILAATMLVVLATQIASVILDRPSPFGEYVIWLVLGLVAFLIVSLLAQFALVMNRNLRVKAEISERWAKLEAAVGHEKRGPEAGRDNRRKKDDP